VACGIAVTRGLALLQTNAVARVDTIALVCNEAPLRIEAPIGLRGLGDSPPRCCFVPTHVERMHKRELRCACHCAYLWGVAILLLCGLAIAKFQVLARYLSEDMCIESGAGTYCASSHTVMSSWSYDWALIVLVPCVLGLVLGVFPICYAMVVSRSRAERREAMAGDVPLKMYKQDQGKELTAPRPVLQGPPPNLAMLNPVLDSDYAANYSSTAPPASSVGIVGGRVEKV